MGLDDFARVPLLFGPSPVHPLPRLSAALGGEVEIWAKREDWGWSCEEAAGEPRNRD